MKRIYILSFILIATLQNSFAQKNFVDTIEIFSKAMQKKVKVVVVKPDNYKNKKDSFPVVYLLHGYSGSYNNWPIKMPNLQQWATENNMVIVSPDGGYSGWYVNSPIVANNQYETFISEELVNFMDQHFKTFPVPAKRGITGLSMGGHGALMLGITHPEIYGAAASMSGAVNLMSLANRYEIKAILGDTAQHLSTWKKYSVVDLADTLTNNKMSLLVDCGIKDIFINDNRLLHQILLKQNINHTYIEREGGHTWSYWTNALPDHLLFFRKFFNKKD
jgi:S-formylglutathione hydrolase FrmB